MRAKGKTDGICKLTCQHGTFVKSHILPKTLTRPSISGAPLVEETKGNGFKPKWSSWYDSALVTRQGEDILSSVDDRGIKELRHHQLIWSSWTFHKPKFDFISHSLPDHGLRCITVRDSYALKLFALSILWRASASSLEEMRHVSISDDWQDALRQIVAKERVALPYGFPVCLMQISTRGEIHNHSPFLNDKLIYKFGEQKTEKVPFARLYLDGLIMHVHMTDLKPGSVLSSPSFLCCDNTLLIPSVTYEASFQYENTLILGFESVFGPISSQPV